MNNPVVTDIINMSGMLQYLGCRDISMVMNKIHFWDFPKSITKGYIEYGSLTEKQKDSIVALIEKHTGVECKVCNEERLVHVEQYKSNQPSKDEQDKNIVFHNFKNLVAIQLFDLPLESGETKSYIFYPYNAYSIVVQINGEYYKVPNPENFKEIHEPTVIEFNYKRTDKKGFCTQV